MPYSAVKELPPAVKKLSAEKQKQWMAVFNSVHAQSKDEARAFAAAWKAVGGAPKEESVKKGKSEGFDLQESTSLEEAVLAANINSEAGIIKDVVLMTADKRSKNKTRYLRPALEQALTRYEGAKMFIDHPRKDELQERRGSRSLRDLGGTYRNVRIVEGAQPKLLGDLHLMEHNKHISLSIAKNPPKDTGLSLRDRGLVREEKGETLVEGFEGDEFSIDMVVSASLNKSLFESAQPGVGGGEEEMDITKLTMEELKSGRKDLVEAIQQEATAALKKQLEEAGVKSVNADKLVALAESTMSLDFKDAVRPAIMKTEVTLEEAKKIILAQEGLFVKLNPTEKKKPAGDGDPKLKTGANRSEEIQEGEIKDEDIIAAFQGSNSL